MGKYLQVYAKQRQKTRTRAMSGPRASLFNLPQSLLEEHIVARLPANDVVRFWAAHPLFQTHGFWGRQYALRHKESAARAAALGVVSSVWPLESGSREEFGEEARFVMGKRRKTLVHNRWADVGSEIVCSVAFSPDGRTLASSSYYIRLWDAVTGALKEDVPLDAENGMEALAFSPDGSTLVVTVSESRIVLVDTTTCAVRRLPGDLEEDFALGVGEEGRTSVDHPRLLNAFALSPDGRTIVARSRDHTALLVDGATGATKATLAGQKLTTESAGHFGRIGLVFSPNGRTLACGGADNFPAVMLWDVATGVLKARLIETYARLVFSPDSRTIATLQKGNTMLWETETGALKATLDGSSYDLAFSPDGRMVATCPMDNGVRLWDAVTGALKATLVCGEPATIVSFSPDERTLVTCHEAPDYETDVAFVNLWDTATGALRATLLGSGEFSMGAVVFSPDGRTLVAAADEGVHMWGVDTV